MADVNREVMSCENFFFFFFFFFFGGGGSGWMCTGRGEGGSIWGGGGGQGRCEQRSEVFVKIQNKLRGGSGREVGLGGGGSGWM